MSLNKILPHRRGQTEHLSSIHAFQTSATDRELEQQQEEL